LAALRNSEIASPIKEKASEVGASRGARDDHSMDV
jgi:hypothetical protein